MQSLSAERQVCCRVSAAIILFLKTQKSFDDVAACKYNQRLSLLFIRRVVFVGFVPARDCPQFGSFVLPERTT
jgi:hypothetical protein